MRFRLAARDLSLWSPAVSGWVLEPGEFTLAVGGSSRVLPLTATIDVAAPPLPVRLDGAASLREWRTDPTGSALLREVVGADETGRLRGALGNDELAEIIGDFPIRRLAGFPDFGLDHDMVDDLLRRAGVAR